MKRRNRPNGHGVDMGRSAPAAMPRRGTAVRAGSRTLRAPGHGSRTFRRCLVIHSKLCQLGVTRTGQADHAHAQPREVLRSRDRRPASPDEASALNQAARRQLVDGRSAEGVYRGGARVRGVLRLFPLLHCRGAGGSRSSSPRRKKSTSTSRAATGGERARAALAQPQAHGRSLTFASRSTTKPDSRADACAPASERTGRDRIEAR